MRRLHQFVGCPLADRHRDRDRHAALARRAVARADQRVDRLVHVGVGHHHHVVLGAAEALHALSRRRAARIDIFGDRGRADEADRLNVGIVEDGVDRFLVAVDDIEDAGRPARLDEQFAEPHRHAGIALRRFQDEGVAAGDRRRELPQRDHRGEIERRDAGDDAERLAHRIEVDAGAGAIGVFALHQMRNAEREFDHLDAALDVALGVGDRLAVLAREDVGELVVVLGDEIDELHQDAGAALRIDRGPGRLRRLGVLDRRAHLGLGGERDMGAHRAVHRLENVGRSTRLAGDVLAADEMPVLDHVPLPDAGFTERFMRHDRARSNHGDRASDARKCARRRRRAMPPEPIAQVEIAGVGRAADNEHRQKHAKAGAGGERNVGLRV